MSLYIDLTEFLANPITSGIQRVVGEICRNMPADRAIPVRLRSGQYWALSSVLIPAIGKHFSNPTPEGVAEIRRLGEQEAGPAVRISQSDIVLIPEVFLDPQRVAFFCNMPENEFARCRFIVYDLLPFTHPQYFPPNFLDAINGYFRVIRKATCCGFISSATREIYHTRLKRTDSHTGVVLSLGSDSLGPRAENPPRNRSLKFTVIGTVEPRKNHALILDAFEPLLREIPGLRLIFVGSMGWVEAPFAERVYALARDETSGFQFCSAPSDSVIRNHIEESRATIYLSAAEGYGLPPVESLWCGTPVIASPTIPSLQTAGSSGVHYVDPLNVQALRKAVLAFTDDSYANRKIEETLQANLPTWRSLAEEVLRWCSDAPEEVRPRGAGPLQKETAASG